MARPIDPTCPICCKAAEAQGQIGSRVVEVFQEVFQVACRCGGQQHVARLQHPHRAEGCEGYAPVRGPQGAP
jgi:hypothetical protein